MTYRPTDAQDTERRCPVCGGGDMHSFGCARAAAATGNNQITVDEAATSIAVKIGDMVAEIGAGRRKRSASSHDNYVHCYVSGLVGAYALLTGIDDPLKAYSDAMRRYERCDG